MLTILSRSPAAVPLARGEHRRAATPPATPICRRHRSGDHATYGGPEDFNPVASALRSKLNALPADGSAQELKERAVLSDFYAARRDAPMWLSEAGLDRSGAARAPKSSTPETGASTPRTSSCPPSAGLRNSMPRKSASAGRRDLAGAAQVRPLTARGGRIIDPAILLNSNLDRKPQLLDPEIVIKAPPSAADPAAYVRSLASQAAAIREAAPSLSHQRGKPLAKKLLANMESGAGCTTTSGEMHIMANVPEFMVYLVRTSDDPHRAHRRRRDRQADDDLHAHAQDHRVQSDVARAGIDQGQRAAAQPAARRQPVPPVRSRAADQGRPARSTTARSTGTRPTSAITRWCSRRAART